MDPWLLPGVPDVAARVRLLLPRPKCARRRVALSWPNGNAARSRAVRMDCLVSRAAGCCSCSRRRPGAGMLSRGPSRSHRTPDRLVAGECTARSSAGTAFRAMAGPSCRGRPRRANESNTGRCLTTTAHCSRLEIKRAASAVGDGATVVRLTQEYVASEHAGGKREPGGGDGGSAPLGGDGCSGQGVDALAGQDVPGRRPGVQ